LKQVNDDQESNKPDETLLAQRANQTRDVSDDISSDKWNGRAEQDLKYDGQCHQKQPEFSCRSKE